jgi:oxygen-dependent protoporphyrinogen oxidase
MIGSINRQVKEAVVVGAGITGLLVAYQLSKGGFNVDLYEAGDHVGGLIQTLQTPYGIAETAAHSLRMSHALVKLMKELGVPMVEARPESKKKFIVRGDRMLAMPLRSWELSELFLRALFMPSLPTPQRLDHFVKRHMGRAALNYLITPMCLGIHGSTPDQLFLPQAFSFLDMEESNILLAHLLRTKWRNRNELSQIMAPRDGMQAVVKALSEKISSDSKIKIHLNTPINELPKAPNVILCTPAGQSASLLQKSFKDVSDALSIINYVPLITSTVFVRRKDMQEPPVGLGVLIPPSEKFDILGVIFNSRIFDGRVADPEMESMCVIMGGSVRPDLLKQTDEGIHHIIYKNLDRLLGLKKKPEYVQLTRWPRAIPVYNQAIERLRETALKSWCGTEGRILFGNYTGALSIRNMVAEAEML